MGANVSQEVNAAANESVSIINSQTQSCVTMVNQDQAIQVCAGSPNCNGVGTVTIKNVNFDQDVRYTTQCLSMVNITSDIQNQINQSFSQAAMAIAQQFQLSEANVNQVANVAANVATKIDNTTVQNCVQQASMNQGIQIMCSPTSGGVCNVDIEGVNFTQGFTGINNCILQEQNAQMVINEITMMIEQQGTAKIESLLGPIIAIIIIIIVIIGVVFLGGTKMLGDWRLWVVIIVIVLIYLGLAYWRHWFPFENKSS